MPKQVLKKMFNIFLVTFVLAVLSGCSQVRSTFFAPSDIEIYCRRIFSDSAESSAYRTCIEQERYAKDELSKMIIPPDIEKRCRQLAASTGGSYQVMLTCVQNETRAKER